MVGFMEIAEIEKGRTWTRRPRKCHIITKVGLLCKSQHPIVREKGGIIHPETTVATDEKK